MSLLKIPLILLSATAMQVAFTPPNLTSSNDVIHDDTPNEQTLLRIGAYGFPFAKGLCWSISFVEIAIMALRVASPSTLPSMIQHVVGPLLGRIQDTPITPSFLFGSTLIVTGGLIRWWCFRTLGRLFTFEVSVRKGHQLVTTGPYAVIRHPSYTGILMQCIGLLILYGSRTSWLRDSGVLETIPGLKMFVLAWLVERSLLVVFVLRRISQEEEVVKSHFGDEWRMWAKEVRHRLIPGIY